jgi:hypothetical protein
LDRETAWAREPIWTLWEKEKSNRVLNKIGASDVSKIGVVEHRDACCSLLDFFFCGGIGFIFLLDVFLVLVDGKWLKMFRITFFDFVHRLVFRNRNHNVSETGSVSVLR